MNPLDKNIEKLTRAAKGIEKHITAFENTPDESVMLCKQLMEYINAVNLLQQIKAAQKPNVLTSESKIITM